MDDAIHQTFQPTADQRFDVIILGAGISGLVAASILAGKGNSVLIVDEYGHVGGNHMDWTSGEGFTFDVGSLIFQDDSPLLKHFPELLARYVPIAPTWGRLNPQGRVTAYPISIRDDILAAGPIGLPRIFASVLYARLFQRHLSNAKDFARYWIGAYLLHRSGLETYMRRFYGIAPEEIDLDLATKRMGWISEYASLIRLAKRMLKKKVRAGPTNRQLARPKEGFSELYSAAVDRLAREGVVFKLSAQPRRIEKTHEGFQVILSDGILSGARVVSTIPVATAAKLCGTAPISGLDTITLITLYFSFSGARGFDQSIIYNFSHLGAWKRLTVYSDFYGRINAREYFAVEVVTGQVRSVEEAEADFRRHAAGNGLFTGDLKLENSQVLENAYPIYSKGAAQNAAQAISTLRTYGVESLGRQGGFNYQPTARVTTIEIENAMAAK